MEAFRDSSIVDQYASAVVENGAAQRFIADAEGILARLNNDPRLGPKPFVLLQEDEDPDIKNEDRVAWTSDRYDIELYKDLGDDDEELYRLEINARQLKGLEDVFRFVKMAIANVPSGDVSTGARRRRKTKKANKKRRSTKRRVS
jgi:hypothetical protein